MNDNGDGNHDGIFGIFNVNLKHYRQWPYAYKRVSSDDSRMHFAINKTRSHLKDVQSSILQNSEDFLGLLQNWVVLDSSRYDLVALKYNLVEFPYLMKK